MGLEWILRMSRRACSFGSSMSGEQKWTLDLLRVLAQSQQTEDQQERWRSYGFYDPVFRAATRLGPECPVCWWPWSSWLCAVCRSRPSGSAADRTHTRTPKYNVCWWDVGNTFTVNIWKCFWDEVFVRWEEMLSVRLGWMTRTSCSESGLHKLFPLQGLKLNVGHRPKSNHYCIVLLRCKMVVGSQVPLRGWLHAQSVPLAAYNDPPQISQQIKQHKQKHLVGQTQQSVLLHWTKNTCFYLMVIFI